MGFEANRRVETSAKTFAMVERLRDVGSAGISELANDLDASKGIVHNHVSTLRELGYVEKVGDEYRLSGKFFTLGWRVRERSPLYRFGSPALRRFAAAHDLSAVLTMRAGDTVVVIDDYGTADPNRPWKTGDELPLRSSLPGVAMLATGTGDGLDPTGDDRIAERYDVQGIVASVAERGYATGPLSTSNPLTCVAIPIADETETPRGAIVATSSDRRTDALARDVAADLADVGRRIEDRFEHEWDPERSFATIKHEWLR